MKTNRHFLGGLLGLLISFVAASAQPTQQLPDKAFDLGDLSGIVGPPKVTITEVKGFTGAAGTGFQVQVKWSAQTPSTTTLEKFEVNVAVKTSNAQTVNATKTVAGSAREATVSLTFAGKPVSFDVQVLTFFIPINNTKAELNSTITLDKGNNFSASGATPPQTTPAPPGDGILKIALAQGTDLKGFDVQWRLSQRTQDVIEKQTKVTGTFTYKKNNQTVGTRTANAILGVGTRQARLTVSSVPVTDLGNVKIEATVKIEVIFNLRKRLATSKTGSFPTN